jgi:hypothetical protein
MGPRFSALRDSKMCILHALADWNMEIGVTQHDLKRCSPLIYCVQVRDVHRAKCRLGNRTWMMRIMVIGLD